ncbi:MAG: hypothetical protein E7383_08775 [Ruminococcaceae bacterium]|nr:hypothetical protein [Oscillospiraceae bacterium]
MDRIKAINIKNILVEETGGGIYVSDRVFEREKMEDLDYISELISEMMRLKNINNQTTDALLINEIRIVFPDRFVEAANIIMAVSLFKSFKEQGLLTEDEYLEIVSDNEKRWRNLLYGDSMTTNKVVLNGGIYEKKSRNLCPCFDRTRRTDIGFGESGSVLFRTFGASS